MRSIKLAGLLVGLMVLTIGLTLVPFVSAGPVINTMWTSNPPNIDGRFTQGEWYNLQISMTLPDYPIEAYAYFMNDNSNLYVLVDAVGDKTQDASDECLLVFDFTDNVVLKIFGDGTLLPTTGFNAAAGFYGSQNSQDQHRIYEFRIPLVLIHVQPGQSIEFCSPFWKSRSIVYDASTGKDNIYPNGLDVADVNTWAILATHTRPVSAPVGGFVAPVNKLSVLAPYFALFGLLATVAIVVVKPSKKHED